MNAICDYNDCTGCMACYNVCSHNAIKMNADNEGFPHPVINPQLCIDCGLCAKVCPINHPVSKSQPLETFSGWSNDEQIRLSSSSGGAFVEIAKFVLSRKGVVFGVTMDKNIEARHIYIENEKELEILQGSKYVQSIVGDSFSHAKDFLLQGRMVLFSGTPCQIAGLRNYLRKDYDNLYTIDLVCHGVPSPKVFNDYKHYIEQKIKEPINSIKFRCKKSSWIFFNMGINPHVEKKGTISYSYTGGYYSDPYIRVFLRDNILRHNCYHCQYASLNRVSDFTIGDWWNYKATSYEDRKFDRKGVSLILCNTSKAQQLVQSLNMKLRQRTIEEAKKTNMPLRNPFPEPITRVKFWKDYNNKTFEEMVEKWMYPEMILLSTYCQIYYAEHRILYHVIHLYERILRKIHLQKLIIRIQAK